MGCYPPQLSNQVKAIRAGDCGQVLKWGEGIENDCESLLTKPG